MYSVSKSLILPSLQMTLINPNQVIPKVPKANQQQSNVSDIGSYFNVLWFQEHVHGHCARC